MNIERWEQWVTPYVPYILITCIIILILLIIAVIFTMAGLHANTLTGTEANHWQNLEAII